MKLIKFFVFTIILIYSANVVLAACPSSTQDGAPTKFCNPLGGDAENSDINIFIGKIINSVLGVVGSIALVMFVYGGILWMTSAGNSEQVGKAKSLLTWAVLGLILIFSSYALVKFVLEGVGAG